MYSIKSMYSTKSKLQNIPLLLLLLGVFSLGAPSVLAADSSEEPSTLYVRLGGWEGITQIVTDTVAKHKKNPAIARYFEDVNTGQLIAHVTAFFAAGTGGPNKYEGRDMTSAHAGMGLSDSDFNSAVADVLLAVEENGLSDDVKAEVNAILQSLKPAVMGLSQTAE